MYSYEKSKTADGSHTRKFLDTDKKNTNAAVSNQLFLSEVRPNSGGGDLDELHNKITQRIEFRKNNTGLPDNLKSEVEALSGFSLDNVRVHYNSPKPAHMNANAYTQGTEIHVAPGQESSLPHEAWHVVQQMQGRVKPTLKMNGVNVNNDPSLEREADVLGAKANGFSDTAQLSAKNTHNNAVCQR